MLCPYCGREMRAGLLESDGGVIFAEREKWFRRDEANPRKGEVCLIDQYWPFTSTPAHWCDACEVLIWDCKTARLQ